MASAQDNDSSEENKGEIVGGVWRHTEESTEYSEYTFAANGSFTYTRSYFETCSWYTLGERVSSSDTGMYTVEGNTLHLDFKSGRQVSMKFLDGDLVDSTLHYKRS
ncbi:hypothetical protein Pelo_10653 [Pelomyxa schiedti]|nr:hypothetical protein Pelo_10653 [Pelomyxa schiedti]